MRLFLCTVLIGLLCATAAYGHQTLDKATTLCSQSGGTTSSDIQNSYVCSSSTPLSSDQLVTARKLCVGYYHGIVFDANVTSLSYACYF